MRTNSSPTLQNDLPSIEAQKARDHALAAAREYLAASRSTGTWRAYRTDWLQFERWCRSAELATLPASPETVAFFIAAEARRGLRPATISRRLSAIRMVHHANGHESPGDAASVREVLGGIKRSETRKRDTRAPLVDDLVKHLADACDTECAKGCRDRALVLLGFAGAFRRSELVAIEFADVVVSPEGARIAIRSSKTDQERVGHTVAVLRQAGSAYCPVDALQHWLACSGINEGPVFRRVYRSGKHGDAALSPQSVAVIVKDLAFTAGLDVAAYSAHSLRSGFLTSAARSGASVFKMAAQSRHRSLNTLQAYVQDSELFDNHAGESLLKS